MTLVLRDPSDPILWTPSRPMSEEDIRTHAGTFPLLAELMREKRGVGLSAVQVGLPLAFFVTGYEAFPVCCNPHFSESLTGYVSKLEGCLSKPGWHTYVRRAAEINTSWMDAKGEMQSAILSGIEARVFQHLYDLCAGKPIFPRPLRPTPVNA